jgi:RNA polymerase sigma factor (sigma-70 family)
MYPFSDKYDETQDKELVKQAFEGSAAAIEKLIGHHQRFIYNLALKLVRDPDDAADITQEVLIKMITRLHQYKQKSSFRTWLYRIVMNHFISMKRRKLEEEIYSFDELGAFADKVHNGDGMTVDEQAAYSSQIAEVRDRCMTSTLLCLDREQRIVLILGGVFNIRSTIAARLLDITPENFRKQLSRAKADLFQFMDNKCGLIDPANPCRCHKKTKGFIKEGKVNAATGQFDNRLKETISTVAGRKNNELDDLMEGKYLQLFTSQVYEDTNTGTKLSEKLLMDPDIRQLFQLSE